MNRKSPTLKKGETPLLAFIKESLKTGALAVVIAGVLLCIAAAVICRVDVPHTALQPVTTALAASAAFLSTLLTAKRSRSSGLAMGAATGLVLFAAVFFLSSVLGNRDIGAQFLTKLIAVLCAGGLGGMLSKHNAQQKTKLKM